MEKALDQQLRNSKFSKSAKKSQKRGCYYTSVPHVIKHKGLHAQELTSLNLDKVMISVCDSWSIIIIWQYFYIVVFADMCNWWSDLPDTVIRKHTDEGLWRFRRPTSWRATICFYCIFGMHNSIWDASLLISIVVSLE